MIKKATSGVLVVLLVLSFFGYSPKAKAQTASPSQATISVSGVPAGTKSLAVEVTVDSAVLTLGSASTTVGGALAVTGMEGVGIVATSGELPESFDITVTFTGVAEGMSSVTVGMVLDMIGGTEIAGASAMSDVTSVTVGAAPTSTSSSTTSSTGGVGGNLDNDTLTVTITGGEINTSTALNVTITFGDTSIAKLASANPTFMGAGATQLLTASDPDSGVLTVVWDGTITDNVVTITAMLEPGTMAGTTSIGVGKVEAAGGKDITSSVVAQVSPTSVTNSAEVAGDCGTFALVAPTSVTGPGSAAVGFSVSSGGANLSGTLNGSMVTFTDGAGVGIVDLPSSGNLDLSLDVMCSAGSDTIDLGSISVTAGSGDKVPVARRATAKNRSNETLLRVAGKNFRPPSDVTFDIIPTTRTADTVKIKSRSIKAEYQSSECIPDGSFVNVTSPAGTDGVRIKVRGDCANPLVE